MALIPCPDCGRDVSESAPTCPQCGRPIAQAVTDGTNPVVTTELTGKGIKVHIILAWVTLLLGLLGLFEAPNPDKTVYSWMLGVGFVWLVIAKVVRWWRHA